ncbi:hypothetical protein [Streptomyces sp. LMG1-1-1.1]|uniref:hypothetical protein n=1 Tax=Streptomyces sp. LMG1-1-1.1 TaxID=3135245 RepID=UPI003466DC56
MTVLFLSSIVTAVSTLGTAYGVLIKPWQDWRPAEYRILRELRGGHTLERFTEKLGTASYREPLEVPDAPSGGTYTKYVFRPREDYRVEVVADQHGDTKVYTVTSCRPDFRPTFERVTAPGTTLKVTLGASRLSDADTGIKVWITRAGKLQGVAYQSQDTLEEGGFREYAWGANDVCPISSPAEAAETKGLWQSWESWHQSQRRDEWFVVTAEHPDARARELMGRSAVNVYVETAQNEPLAWYYKGQLGVTRVFAD